MMLVAISMAQSQFVSKSRLYEQLTQIIEDSDTGFLTILTDTNRSVLIRFSTGSITRIHCRSKELGEAIQVLAESAMVKFTYAAAPEDTEPELMPAETFLQLINPGGDLDASGTAGQSVSSDGMQVSDPVKAQMLELAVEFIGVIAEMIVDEAFEDNSSVSKAIDYIAETIPDPNQSQAFRAAARKHFSSVDI